MSPRAKQDSIARSNLANARACRAHDDVIKVTQRVSEDLDQITQPGVPIEISEEDSMVTQIESVLEELGHPVDKAG